MIVLLQMCDIENILDKICLKAIRVTLFPNVVYYQGKERKRGTQFFGGGIRLPPLSIPLLVGNPVIATFDSLLK